MVGEYLEENTKKIKDALLEYFEAPHRKKHLQRDAKRNDKTPLLEFLESCLSWLVNSTSQKVSQHYSTILFIYPC